MEIIRELCSFEGRLAGTDAERRAANRLAERLRELGRRAEVEPTYVHPQSALVHAAHCLLGFAGSLVAIAVPALGFGARPARGDLDVPRPQRPLLPAPLAVLPPRLAERRLPRREPGRAGAADHLRPLRRRPHRRRLRPAARAPRCARLAAALAVAPRPVPDPVLVAGAAAPAARRCGWRASTPTRLGAPAPPHPDPPGRRSSPWSRSSSPRSSRAPTTTPPGVATAISLADELERRPAREPRRLGRARRRRGVPAGGHARVRPLPPQASSTAERPSSSRSTRSAAATSASRPAPAGSSATRMDRRLIELCEAIADGRRRGRQRFGAAPLRQRARPATRCRRGSRG